MSLRYEKMKNMTHVSISGNNFLKFEYSMHYQPVMKYLKVQEIKHMAIWGLWIIEHDFPMPQKTALVCVKINVVSVPHTISPGKTRIFCFRLNLLHEQYTRLSSFRKGYHAFGLMYIAGTVSL